MRTPPQQCQQCLTNAPDPAKRLYKHKHIWTIYLPAYRIHQNMKAYQPHPFCLESNLTITGRRWADDGWKRQEETKNGNFTVKLFRV